MKRKVVVTGMGIVSPVGSTIPEAWKNITAGVSGIGPITSFDSSNCQTKIAGEVKNFDPLLWIDRKDLKKTDPFVHYALGAAGQALEDARILSEPEFSLRAGVAIGTAIGGISEIEANALSLKERGKVSPFLCSGSLPNAAPGAISIQYKLRGPNIGIATACSSAAHAIGMAKRMIEHDDVDVMVAGGSDKVILNITVSGHNVMRALSTRNHEPERASRPWDRDRDGFVLGEGAGILILEEYGHALRRGARIYAHLTGFAMTGDAFHSVAPSETGEGAARCMLGALKDAHLQPKDIQYINAHGTSTPVGDRAEVLAIKKVFGKSPDIMVSSTKSMTGHLLGAAGGIEAVFTVLALHHGIIPPTINLENPDEGFDLDFVPHTSRLQKVHTVMSNSFGFGGTNGCLIFQS